jgi:hypothetical protein
MMTGIEYSIDPSSTDSFFIIRKTYHVVGSGHSLLNLYFVVGTTNDASLHGTVYMMPDSLTVMKTNLISAIHYLHDALKQVNEHRQYSSYTGTYQWKFIHG